MHFPNSTKGFKLLFFNWKKKHKKNEESINVNRNDDSLCCFCCCLLLSWDSEWYRLCKKFNSCTRLKEIKRHDDNLYQEILINCVFLESILKKKRKWYDNFPYFSYFFSFIFCEFHSWKNVKATTHNTTYTQIQPYLYFWHFGLYHSIFKLKFVIWRINIEESFQVLDWLSTW